MQTIIDFLQSFLGVYEPIYTTYAVDADTTIQVVASGASGVNWEYILAGALLLIVVYSVFRLLGCLFGGLYK